MALFSVAVVAAAAVTAAAQPSASIRYLVEFRGGTDIAVTISLPEPVGRPTQFVMPRAIPMGYGSHPYDRFVVGLTARDRDGRPIDLIDLEGPRWTIRSGPDRPLGTITYRVNLERMERTILSAGDASRVRPDFIGLLGYAIFGFVEGLQDHPIDLEVRVPPGWPIVTTLMPTVEATGATRARAANFYALADAQIMGGPGLARRRVASAVPLLVASYSEGPLDLAALVSLADTALRQAATWFGSTPFPHFTVSLEALRPLSPDHQYQFSMEHLESATFRYQAGQVDVSPAGRTRLHYNLLHHMAHAWIPKRCAPAGYYPFVWDYSAPIEMIWFSEGWAQYAAADMLALGTPDPAATRRRLTARRFEEAGADTLPPIGGLSTAALSAISAHQYSDDFRLAQTTFARGGLMADAIDRRIRDRTGGRKNFRDVVHALLAWCATATTPVTVETLVTAARGATGVEVGDLIEQWLVPRGRSAPGRPRP